MEPQDADVIDLTGLSLASSDGSARETSRELSEDASIPWYQDPQSSHPFSLAAKCRAPRASASSFTGVEFFPWGDTRLEHLWNGDDNTTEDNSPSQWHRIRSKWRNTAAVCGGRVVRLINTSTQRQGAPLFQISLPENCLFTVTHVKWALNPRNLHPLIIYVHSSVLHVFDVEARSFLGCIRGHGADITSLGVHRMHPHIVCTTSRDFTTRIYDFRVSGQRKHDSSHQRRRSGFGRVEIDDGDSHIGKCVVVLTGGRSGGHEAAVLGAVGDSWTLERLVINPSNSTVGFSSLAALDCNLWGSTFHRVPLILADENGGQLDHAVRIWYLKPQLFLREGYSPEETGILNREDKPLFSSSLIHEARILSVYWLSLDLLVSHSAPPMRTARMAGHSEDTGSGTLAVWQWLSIGRFFPPEAPIHREAPLRGCISDYRESSSFKMLSLSQLPADASRMSAHRMRRGPPLILFTARSKILVLNASQLPPRNRPVLHDDRERGRHGSAPQSKRIRLSGAMAEDIYTDVEGWTLSTVLGEDLEDEELAQCEMSPDGRRVAAVGSRDGIWMWSAE